MNIQQPLIEAPASDNYRAVQTLGYLDAYDAVLNDDYAFVAFKETEKSSGSYEIKIKSRHTAGAVFDPAMIRAKCREAGAHNQPYFTWGYSCEPSAGDPRRIEFRVHQRNGAPDALEIVVVTRKADGSAQDPKSLRIDNFMPDACPTKKPLVEAPASDSQFVYQTLGYLESYDAPLNIDYAFVAYKETDKASGNWRVLIKSTQTASGSFEPAMIRNKAREAGAQGKPYFVWGYSFEPSQSDPRQIEFRVYQQNGVPVELEIFLVTRNGDGSATAPKSVKFSWPAA
jgi:hypothetical protein